MLESLFAPTLGELERALGYESTRQRVIAHNIANVNTPGYKAKSIFRLALSQAQSRQNDTHLPNVPSPNVTAPEDERGIPYEIVTSEEPSIRPDGNNVNLESQMVELADAELRYRALTQMASRYFQGLRRVIGGSGR
ncbi:MAG: flagellar basal body rod protein FlgB [Fimbriimonadia bacterium]|jgi:flagellar basal-body rod protein FlgB